MTSETWQLSEKLPGLSERLRRYIGPERVDWSKLHSHTAADFARLYPRWNDFLAVRQQLDPSGRFLNDHLRRVFGLL